MRLRATLPALRASAGTLCFVMSATAQVALTPGYDEAVAAAEASGWTNGESQRSGLHLVADFDSEAPGAWDPAEHPLVHITSKPHFNPNPKRTIDGAFAGFHLIDAMAKEVFADWIGVTIPKESDMRTGPHGAVISPDGKWAYVGWAEVDDSETRFSDYAAAVKVHTLKIEKLLRLQSRFRGVQRSQRLHHVQACQTAEGKQWIIVLFGFGADGGPHYILDPDDHNRVARSITYDDVQIMGHPFTTPDPACTCTYVSIGSPEIRSAEAPFAGVAKLNMDDGSVTNIMGTGHHPIGITHSADGQFTYVVDGHGSHVYKIDNEENEVVGHPASLAGPYGIAMNGMKA